MRILPPLVGTFCFVLGAGPVGAATLFTPPIQTNNGEEISCSILNTTAQNREYTIQVINAANAVVEEVSGTVPAHSTRWAEHTTTFTLTHCRFEFSGTKGSVRAAACIKPAHVASCQSIIAGE